MKRTARKPARTGLPRAHNKSKATRTEEVPNVLCSSVSSLTHRCTRPCR